MEVKLANKVNRKQYISGVWKFYERSEDNKKAKCKLCSTELKYQSGISSFAKPQKI